MNFMKDFEIQARQRPTAPALHCDGMTHTYGDLMKAIDGCGLALKKTGVEPGERVALMMNNRVEFVIAYQAAVKIGAIIVPINTFLKESELQYQLKDIEPKVFIGNDWSAFSIGPIKDEIESLKEIVLTGVDEYTDFDEFVSSEKGQLEMYEANDDETAVIKFTAGTTGKSKGAMQTHGNVSRFMSDTMDIGPIQPEECILLFVPMFHGFGDHCCMNLVFKVGASYAAMDPFDPDKILRAIQDHRCTYFGCTPSMLYGLLYHPEV
ncbi:MAG: acyl--CoA ligase, partial [Deltaproteobacteria bacterium]|nr:acyl--CoA ligase [Deltaproteobacteria bacterium]